MRKEIRERIRQAEAMDREEDPCRRFDRRGDGTPVGAIMRNLGVALVVLAQVATAFGGIEEAERAMDKGHYAAALKEYPPLADEGNARAQFALGWMYANGRGVPQDDAPAGAWFRLPADRGLAKAQYALGARYAEGRGVPKDTVQAYRWCSLAGIHGYETGNPERDRIAKEMTRKQIAEARRMVREWAPTRP